ncbi:hypothetical protein FNF27_06123 [Cafeteria roenbergensis]|uniref:Response regulatory domain-containing protein n=1 Tax=Cafeteria roenbergensis TaxID=33653 RepID=A0A5A8E3Z4_CAFRO|nr:hypothetical protein FNF27_06123 [Cafeteria roenbergensis]
MPVMDGFGFLDALLRYRTSSDPVERAMSSVRVEGCTGNAVDEIREGFMRRGAVGVMTKPVHRETIVAAVLRAVKSAERHGASAASMAKRDGKSYSATGGPSAAPAVAAALSDGAVRVMHVSSAGLTGAAVLRGHAAAVSCVTFHGDAPGALLSAGADSTVRAWDLRSRAAVFRAALPGPCAAIAARGHLIAAAADTDVVFLDDRKPTAPLGSYTETHAEPVTCVALGGPSGAHAITGSEDGMVALFDTSIATEDDALMSVLPMPGRQHVRACGFFGAGDGGAWGVSATSDLVLWSLASADVVASFPDLPGACRRAGLACDTLLGCHFDAASGALTCAGSAHDSGAVAVMNVRRDAAEPVGQLAVAPPSGHSDSVRCIDWIAAAAAGGGAAAGAGALSGCVTGGEDGRVCLWGSGFAPAGAASAAAAAPAFVVDAVTPSDAGAHRKGKSSLRGKLAARAAAARRR